MENATLTELEKLLYNKHLAVSRSEKGKPFKLKRDFRDIVGTPKHKFLQRISTLFKKHPEIEYDTFFRSPYRLYPDVEYFDLEYFSSMRAVRSYTMYRKMQFLQDPDSQLESCKESLHFIANFCVKEGIHLHQYPFHRNSDVFTWMSHFKQNKINIYTMMEFSDVLSAVQSLAEDVQKFYVGQFVENFKSLYINYIKSEKLRPYLKKAFSTLNNFINRELTQPLA